jgi:DNA polymerase I
MSDSCAAFPTSFDRFDHIWHVDFEYRQNRNLLPVPVCMYAVDQRTGQEIFLWREQLLELRQAPFGTGPRDLMVAYSASAELACFLQLGWRFPENILDPFLETAALTNGNRALWPHKWRPGLLDALQIFGLHGIDAGEKDEMRDLILNHETYTPDECRRIRDYNRSDVIATSALLLAIADRIDMPYALLRGRYQKAVSGYETIGLPVDTTAVAELLDNRTALKLDYIERNNMGEFFDGTRFVGDRLTELILRNGWETHWPLTPTGKFETGDEILSRMAALHPELAPLARLHSQLGALRGSELANTIGVDGYARCPIRPLHTLTGRNQLHGRDRIFIPALPQWLHGMIKPRPGWACVELDWSAQEVGIMAARSGDPNMIADFLRGDCHTAFALRARLITEETEPDARTLIRNKQAKPVVLGSNYDMTPWGIQRKTGKSWEWSKHIHRQHRVVYPVYHEWLNNVVTQARFDQHISTPYGWPMFVGYDTPTRRIMNFPAQGGGSDAMRHAAIMAVESGIVVNCPVHDSFRIMAPIEDLAPVMRDMDEIMRAAGALVTGSFELPTESKTPVIYPNRQADLFTPKDRGHRTWTEVWERIRSGELAKYRGRVDEDETGAPETDQTGGDSKTKASA